MMYGEPEVWHRLMDKFARVITGYLRRQIKAGAQAVQLFDSWVGCLSAGDYAEYVMPHVQLILTASSMGGCRSFISAPGRPPSSSRCVRQVAM